MKKTIFVSILLVLFFVINGFGQKRNSVSIQEIKDLRRQISEIKAENDKFRKNFVSTSEKIETQNERIVRLQSELDRLNESIGQKTNSINEKVDNNDSSANQKITTLADSLSRNTIIWLIVSILAAIFSIVLFWLLKRTQQSEKSDLESAIGATRKSLEEESIRLDNKLAEILEIQLNRAGAPKEDNETDHSLVLKVANELNRMRMNIINMNPETKGLKQLNRALNNMIDSLQSKGYEIIDLLGKPYDIGMNVIASMEPDEKLNIGEERIRRIIKPQINFDGKVVQAGEVVVGYVE